MKNMTSFALFPRERNICYLSVEILKYLIFMYLFPNLSISFTFYFGCICQSLSSITYIYISNILLRIYIFNCLDIDCISNLCALPRFSSYTSCSTLLCIGIAVGFFRHTKDLCGAQRFDLPIYLNSLQSGKTYQSCEIPAA